MEPKVSVIMPIYNAEDRMSVSIDSVLSQSFEDFELILVNDGSTDRSAVICDAYAELDDRVVVLHQENNGVSAARNLGINQARGKYINFVDADDTIEPHTYKLLMEYVKKSDYDLIIFGMSFDYYKEGVYSHNKIEKVQSNIELQRKEIGLHFFDLYRNNYLSSSCNKMFKSSLIKDNKIKFNTEMAILEDLNFTLDILDYTERILVISDPLYHYYNEIAESSFSRRPNIDYMKNFKILDERLRKTAKNLSLESKEELGKINSIIIRGYIIHLEYIYFGEMPLNKKYMETKKFVNNKRVIKASQFATIERLRLKLINSLIRKKRVEILFVVFSTLNIIKQLKR